MGTFSQRQSLEQEIIEKALKDPGFRASLVADPKGTLEKNWGVTLPADLNVVVHTESPNELHVVLPNAGTDSLSMDDLQLDSWSSWGHFTECVLECTQCGNNDTSCQPGPTGE
jgi:Nitrile hydratase, alpha chain